MQTDKTNDPKVFGTKSTFTQSTDDVLTQLLKGSVPYDQRLENQSVVQACIKVIAETVGKLPAALYKRKGKERTELLKHVMLKTLTRYPNDYQTMQNFLEMIITHLCLDGNFYAVLVKTNDGNIVDIIPFENPRSVTPQIIENKLIYSVSPNQFISGFRTTYSADEILHIRMGSGMMLTGQGIVQQARLSIETALQQERYARQFTEKAATPSAIVTLVDGADLDDDRYDRVCDSLNSMYGGISNAGKVAVLPTQANWQSIALNHKDAQFLESRQFQRTEICSLFRVPEHLISGSANVKYGNYEQSMLSFYTETISPYLTRIKTAINKHLPDGIEFELDDEELKRGDSATATDSAVKLIQAGIITVNEGRAKLGYSPLEGGDRVLLQSNNYTIGSVTEHLEIQDARITANHNAQEPKENNHDVRTEETPTVNNEDEINKEPKKDRI